MLSIVTVALSVCNHSAAICDRMSSTLKSTGDGSLWAQISCCSPWSRSMMFGSAESDWTELHANWPWNRPNFRRIPISYLCDQNLPTSLTDRRRDRRTGGRRDDMRSEDHALHSSASRGKNHIRCRCLGACKRFSLNFKLHLTNGCVIEY